MKLGVLGALLEAKRIDLGSPEELAKHVHQRDVDLEEEGYAFDRAVYDYLIRYPLSDELLNAVETFAPWAADEIYRYVFYFYDGETDEFVFDSLDGIERCPAIRVFGDYGFWKGNDLSPLAVLTNIETVSLQYGSYEHLEVVQQLPKLRHVTCFNTMPAATIEALRARGVEVKIYE